MPYLGETHLLLALDDVGDRASGLETVRQPPGRTAVTPYEATVEEETLWPSGRVVVVAGDVGDIIYDERVKITRINDDTIEAAASS